MDLAAGRTGSEKKTLEITAQHEAVLLVRNTLKTSALQSANHWRSLQTKGLQKVLKRSKLIVRRLQFSLQELFFFR